MAKLRVGREVKPRTSRHPRVMAFLLGTALEHQEHAVAWKVRGGWTAVKLRACELGKGTQAPFPSPDPIPAEENQ